MNCCFRAAPCCCCFRQIGVHVPNLLAGHAIVPKTIIWPKLQTPLRNPRKSKHSSLNLALVVADLSLFFAPRATSVGAWSKKEGGGHGPSRSFLDRCRGGRPRTYLSLLFSVPRHGSSGCHTGIGKEHGGSGARARPICLFCVVPRHGSSEC